MSTINQYLNEQLRRRAEQMADGEKFPTEAELCEEYSVSRMTVSKVLKDISKDGLLIRNRRRGTFVRKPPVNKLEHFSEWLNEGHLGNSIFNIMQKTLRINIYEYRYKVVRPVWDQLIARFKKKFPYIEIEITTETEDAAKADIIWAPARDDQDFLSIKAFNQTPAAVSAIHQECNEKDYFVAPWKYLQQTGMAGCPLALSTSIYLWNKKLLAEFCPEQNGVIPEHMVRFFLENCDWRSPEFPPAASYVFCPLLLIQWTAEGVLNFDQVNGISGYDRPEVAEYLEFNRLMLEKTRAINNNQPVDDVQDILSMFIDGKLLALNTFSPTLKALEARGFNDFAVSAASVGPYAPVVPVYLGIGKNCRNLKMAAKAIAFFCGSEAQQILGRNHTNIPAHRAIAFSDDFLLNSPENMRQVVEMLDRSENLIDPQCYFVDNAAQSYLLSRYILGDIEMPDLHITKGTIKKEK